MKIVGKHKDYYDGGAQFGFDENVTFVRDINYIEEFRANHINDGWKDELKAIFNERVDFPMINNAPRDFGNRESKYINYNPIFVWFAGSVILGYEIKEYTLNNLPIPTYDMKRYYVYGDEMISKIKDLEYKKYQNHYKKIDDLNSLVSDIIPHMNNFKISNGFDIAKEYNTAYFLVYSYDRFRGNGIIVPTPSLTDIQFFKVKDFIQAWQQIESFLPSLKEEVISEMTDEQKINSHGMDETSFRCQAPGNKKEKRRKNKEKKRNNINI